MKLTSKISNLLEKHPKLKLLIQFIKFGIVGVSNTLLSLAVTYATMAVFKFGFSIDTTWSLNVCTTLGYIAGVCNSYFWNKRYVIKNAKAAVSKLNTIRHNIKA